MKTVEDTKTVDNTVENLKICKKYCGACPGSARLFPVLCQVITHYNYKNMSGYNTSQTNIYVGV
jgi:hypothetical protein